MARIGNIAKEVSKYLEQFSIKNIDMDMEKDMDKDMSNATGEQVNKVMYIAICKDMNKDMFR